MCSYKGAYTTLVSPVLRVIAVAMLLLAPTITYAGEFDASVAPDGRYLLKIYPHIYFTSAYFSDKGKALNLPDVTELLYFEVPVQIQYGLTDALSIGAILPIGWTYQEVRPDLRSDPINRLTAREFWLTVQHKWLAFSILSSSSVRIKIPLAKKKDWEDGLRIGDGQVDIYPVYYFEYFSKTRFWYTEFTIGYKYRFKTGERKPFDELNFVSKAGYELVPDGKMRFFFYADLTTFQNGEFTETDLEFFEHEGSLHTFGYGVSAWFRPTLSLKVATGGDWSGRNRYRGMRWTFGITQIR